jgi:LysM repeat protein
MFELLETGQAGGFMRKKLVILISLVVLLLVSCSNSDNPADVVPVDDDTDAIVAEGGTVQEQEAPRVEVTPTPPLPPTYTPSAVVHQGHLYLLPVSGAGGEIQWAYIVRPGDTLSAICEMYDVSFDDVVGINNLTDPNHIEAGTQLIIPIADS